MTTLFHSHVERWEGCTLCPLSSQRTKMVFVRGDVPAEILFLGEAPGASEDVVGLPMVGPAGKLMDQIVEQALTTDQKPTFVYANLVCCFPRIAKAAKTNEPSSDEIKACSPRLKEFVDICKPRLVVLVGKLAAKWAHLSVDMADPNIRCVEICHPATILRAPPQNFGLMVQRCVVTISDALEEPLF